MANLNGDFCTMMIYKYLKLLVIQGGGRHLPGDSIAADPDRTGDDNKTCANHDSTESPRPRPIQGVLHMHSSLWHTFLRPSHTASAPLVSTRQLGPSGQHHASIDQGFPPPKRPRTKIIASALLEPIGGSDIQLSPLPSELWEGTISTCPGRRSTMESSRCYARGEEASLRNHCNH